MDLKQELLNKTKFINLNKIGLYGFIIENNNAIFYSGKFAFKFRIDLENEKKHFEFDWKEKELVEKIFDDQSLKILNKINNFFKQASQINLPKNEFFDFLDIIYKSDKHIDKYSNEIKIIFNNDNLKIINQFKDMSNKSREISFDYEIENKHNFEIMIKDNFKTFTNFIKSKKQDFNFFVKKENALDLFIAKNNNFELLTLL